MKVMIYEVKSSANDNFDKLFKEKFFYWNYDKFRDILDEDRIFVVNTHYKKEQYSHGIVLFCKLKNKNINVEGGNTVIDENEKITIKGNWKSPFYKFEILDKKAIPKDLEWESLRNSETTYLKKENYIPNSSTIENNLKRINFFLNLFKNNEEIQNVLRESEKYLNSIKNSQQDNQLKDQDLAIIDKIFLAIKTKPFIILAGLSGMGKSSLVRTLAYKTCPKELREDNKPGNFEMISVRPNWHDSSELLGYISRINGEKYVVTKFLRFLSKAWKHKDVPFFLLLDEMNLAPVEHYFAEYLSVIETRRKKENEIVTDFLISKSEIGENLYNNLLIDLELSGNDYCKEGISIPQNFIVVGTVNMDETTHSFSKKVLDRAMTFEISEVNLRLGLENININWDYPQKIEDFKKLKSEYTSGAEVWKQENFEEKEKIINELNEINEILNGTPFIVTYRTRDEILIYCYHAKNIYSQNNEGWLDKALDEIIAMKILPKIEGDESKTRNALENLLNYFNCRNKAGEYKIVCSKLSEMKKMLDSFGYTSFWK